MMIHSGILENNISNQRHLSRIGSNLQLIMKRLGRNQKLLRYLKYTDSDPLSKDKPDLSFPELYKEQLRIIPIIPYKSDATSIVSIRVLRGNVLSSNPETMELFINIEVFVPITQWILKGDNLRPFLIMGEITKSLDGQLVDGLGQMNYSNFSINFLTQEMSTYQMNFTLILFN